MLRMPRDACLHAIRHVHLCPATGFGASFLAPLHSARGTVPSSQRAGVHMRNTPARCSGVLFRLLRRGGERAGDRREDGVHRTTSQTDRADRDEGDERDEQGVSSRSWPSSLFENVFTKLIRFDMIPPPRHRHRMSVRLCGVAACCFLSDRGATPRHGLPYRNGYATARAAARRARTSRSFIEEFA